MLLRLATIVAILLIQVVLGDIRGLVVGVTDGDTVTVLDEEKHSHKVRLYGIDAPEKRQDYGERAKEALSKAIYKKRVLVKECGKDRYGRVIGKIFYKRHYINYLMVAKGLAWHYEKYAPKDEKLREAQAKARERKLGLWKRGDAVAPWEFRNKK